MNTLLCALAASLLCLGAPSATAATAPVHQSRLPDVDIEAKIRAKLAKSKIGKDGFQVRVKNGVATWQGSTGVMQHKGAATRMAKTAGAAQVVNNIKVSESARARAAGNLSGEAGGPRRAQVKLN